VLVLVVMEILPPLGKYKYDTWRILPVKCYINNFVRLWSCVRNVNNQVGYGLSVAPQNRWVDDSVRGTCGDLAACFTWPQDWRRHNDCWCTWHHCRGCFEWKPKMDGSMRRAASDSSTPTLPLSLYSAIRVV
jgi:hypothetical protein